MAHTVLVVDDDPDLLDILVFAFQLHGYRVLRAGDGLAALALVEGDCPDVVVTDVVIPGLDGITLARRLQARPDPIPVVLVSAVGSDPHLPGVRFVAKRFDHRDLVAIVAHALSPAP